MLDELYYPKYCFLVVLLLQIYVCSKNLFFWILALMLSFIDKTTTGTFSLMLFIWNISPVVCVASAGLAPPTSVDVGISDTIQFFDHDKQVLFHS